MFKENTFLKESMQAWVKIKDNNNNKNICNKVIWNNKSILIKGKPIFKKLWFEKGIKHISDIYDFRTKEFYKFEDLKELYNLNENDNFFYNQVRSCIPTTWKHQLKLENINDATQQNETLIQKLLKANRPNKILYNEQLKHQKHNKPKSQEKWENDLNNREINWKDVYTNMYYSTIDNTLRHFQYKFIHRIIPTNKSLMKYNIKSSNICDFCNMHVETVKHLFWECNQVQHLWNNISKWLENTNHSLNINYQTISLGITENTQHMIVQAKNYIITLAKYYIFQTKNNKEKPTFSHFKNKLKQKINIEKEIAKNRDKLEIHNMKWRPFLDQI